MSGKRNGLIAIGLFVFVGSMVGAAYAAVPLYRLFCQVTGFGGTTQVAEKAPDRVTNRNLTIRFDANVDKSLSWEFKPVKTAQGIKVGKVYTAHYRATNTGDKPIVGTATYNVSPPLAGGYFNKLECFCFTEQRLEPGQTVDMPIQFFIDPDIAEEKELDTLTAITLSYTFYKVKGEQPLAAKVEKPADKAAKAKTDIKG